MNGFDQVSRHILKLSLLSLICLHYLPTMNSKTFMNLQSYFLSSHWFHEIFWMGMCQAGAKVGKNILLLCGWNQMIQRWWNPAIFNVICRVAGSSHWPSVWNPFDLFSYYFFNNFTKIKSFECPKSKPATHCFIFNLSK